MTFFSSLSKTDSYLVLTTTAACVSTGHETTDLKAHTWPVDHCSIYTLPRANGPIHRMKPTLQGRLNVTQICI